MAYDGTITIDTKIETKGAGSDLKKFNDLLKDKLGFANQFVSGTSKQMDSAFEAAFKNINRSLRKSFDSEATLSNGSKAVTDGLNFITIAQNGLSAAFKASPIGTFSLAVSAVTGAFTILAPILSAVNEKIEEQDVVLQNRKAADARIAAVKEETEAYNQRRRAQQESLDADLAEISHVQGLAAELDGLVDADGRVSEGNEARVQFILSQLNPALDLELGCIDGQVQGYQELRGEIDKVIEKKRAEAMLSAYEETYTEAIKNRMSAYREAGEAQLAYQQEQAEISKIQTENAEDLKTLETYWNGDSNTRAVLDEQASLIMSQQWYKELSDRQKTLKQEEQAYEDKRAVVDQCERDITTYETASTKALAGETQKCMDILNEQSFAYQETAIAAGATDEERRQQMGQSYAESLAAMQEYLKSCTEGTTTFNEADFQGMQEHAARLRTAAEEAGTAIGEGRIEGLNGQEVPLNEAMQKLDEGIIAVQAELAERSAANGQENGQVYGDSYCESVGELPAQVQSTVEDANGQVIDNTKESLGTAIEDADFSDDGKQIMTDAASGVEDHAEEISDAAVDSVEDAYLAANKTAASTPFENIGQRITSKIAQGISSGAPELKAAMNNMINSLLGSLGGTRVYEGGGDGQKGTAKTPRTVRVAWAPNPLVAQGIVSEELMNAEIPNAPEIVARMQAGVDMMQARVAAAGAPRAMHHLYTTQLAGAGPAPATAKDNSMKVGAINVAIDAKNVKEFNDVVKVAQRAVMSYRQGYVGY